MSDRLKIYCVNIREYVDIKGGESLLDIFGRISERIGFMPICARVNHKTEDLSFPVFSPKMVEYLPVESDSGHRTYIRSLCMMLYKAVNDCMPGARLQIVHSLAHGYNCRVTGEGVRLDAATVARLKDYMLGLVARDIRFERKERLTSDVAEIFRRQGMDDKARLLDTLHDLYTVYYRLDGLCDSYYGQLAPSTGMLGVFDLQLYKDGMLLLGPDPANPSEPRHPVSQEKMYKAFTVAHDQTAMLINVSEALHNNRIATLADEISRRFDDGGARIVLIAGPSSSGKTTFTKRLAIQLMTCLLKPQMISLDDYFVDREHTPRDESGEYDYESIYALDIQQFNADLNRLLAGEEVELPYYNFSTGAREYRGNRIKLGDRSILLIEGIHGLNPELTARVDPAMRYRIYVSALTTIAIDDHNWVPTTDNRLLRRIIRDHKYRGTTAVDTIRRWPSVRRGEERWIFPYQENADATFNSSLLFELGVIKEEADRVLSGVPRDIPEYAEASRLRKFLSYFAPIGNEYVPSTSLIREFIGGSSFTY